MPRCSLVFLGTELVVDTGQMDIRNTTVHLFQVPRGTHLSNNPKAKMKLSLYNIIFRTSKYICIIPVFFSISSVFHLFSVSHYRFFFFFSLKQHFLYYGCPLALFTRCFVWFSLFPVLHIYEDTLLCCRRACGLLIHFLGCFNLGASTRRNYCP